MRFTACVFFCLILLVPASFAQSDRGTITGTITDPAGAMIANAAIEAKNTQTGVVSQTVSSATGNYTLAQLPVGIYQLSASVTGFKQYVRTGITVMVAQTLRIDIPLEVGNISETVTVSADAPLLKTESGELSHNVSTERLEDLPLLSTAGGIRNPYTVIQLMPGAQSLSGTFGTFRVNGMPTATLALRVDGQDATQTAWSNATNMSMPGVDSVEETAIQTSNYAAEFGQAGGGVFNMTMRSGTNTLHGSAYDYYRNEAINAWAPYNNAGTLTKPRDRRNDFGFTAGGPVYLPKIYNGKDKTFFFWSYETNRQNTSVNSNWTVPTVAYRNGDFSSPDLWTKKKLGTDPLGRDILEGTIYDPATTRTETGTDGKQYVVRDPFPGNIIPNFAQRIDPVAKAYLNLLNKSVVPTNQNTMYNYAVSYQNSPVTSIHSIKMDHAINSKLKISGYWSLNDVFAMFPDGLQPPLTTQRNLYETTHTVRLNLDYTMTPTVLLHLGAGIMHFVFNDPPPLDGQWDSLKELGLPNTHGEFYPTIYGLYQNLGGGMVSPSGQGNTFGPVAHQTQYQIKPTGTASLNWVKSNHTYKFGAEVRVESYPSTAATPSNGFFTFTAAQTALPYNGSEVIGSGGNIGFPFASFLLGAVDNGEIGQFAKFHVGKHALAFYAQDSWKVTPKLTLDYGLRYDFQTYLKEQYGRIPSFGFDTPNPRFGNRPGAAIFETDSNPFAKNYPFAFGPRIGLAYQFLPKTVLRAGIGISYAQTANLEMWSLRFGSDVRFARQSWGSTEIQLKNGAPVTPVWPDLRPESVPGSAGAPFMTSFDHNAGRPARQIQWSIGIQRELSRNLSFEISYVGNRGAWWNSNGSLTDPNRVTPQILAQHNMSLNDPYIVGTPAAKGSDAFLLKPFGSVSSADLTKYSLTMPYTGFVGTVSQALRPYPQFGGIYVLWAPLGRTWYDSMQMKVTKRFSHGLDLTAAYTYQKEFTVGTESVDTAFMPVNPSINDINNYKSNKTLSGMSIPHRLVIAANYRLPKLNVNKWLSMLVQDWTWGGVLVYQSGQPIHVPYAQTNIQNLLSLCAPMNVYGGCNTSPVASVGVASYANRVPGVPLFTQDLNGSFNPYKTFTLNPAAWTAPALGQFGVSTAFYNDYRYRRRPSENMSLGRIFRIREGMSATIRIEMMNVFNRVQIPNPSADNAFASQVKNSTTGNTQSGFGYIPGVINAGGQRTGQIVARFNF